jgi:hypothetical protein
MIEIDYFGFWRVGNICTCILRLSFVISLILKALALISLLSSFQSLPILESPFSHQPFEEGQRLTSLPFALMDDQRLWMRRSRSNAFI